MAVVKPAADGALAITINVRTGPALYGEALKAHLEERVRAFGAARRVFGGLFLGGADTSNDLRHLEEYRAIVSPAVVRFEHEFSLSSVLFQEGTLSLSVRVRLLDRQGTVVFEELYDSEPFHATADRYLGDSDVITRGAHLVAQALMLRAAADVRKRLLAQAAPPP